MGVRVTTGMAAISLAFARSREDGLALPEASGIQGTGSSGGLPMVPRLRPHRWSGVLGGPARPYSCPSGSPWAASCRRASRTPSWNSVSGGG
jgi:hypothetical protein